MVRPKTVKQHLLPLGNELPQTSVVFIGVRSVCMSTTL